MFRPGPSSTATSCAAASSPRASPMASPRAGSQLLATVALVGKQVAGTLGFRPRWSAAPACLRTPLGPSERVMAGMPFSEKFRVVKTVSPESRAHFCSKFNVFMMSVCFITISSSVPEQGKGPLFWCSGPLPLVPFRCCFAFYQMPPFSPLRFLSFATARTDSANSSTTTTSTAPSTHFHHAKFGIVAGLSMEASTVCA